MKCKKRAYLIVDDEPGVCWALEHVLKARRVFLRKAPNGQEALALMKRHQIRLAFIDAKLPDMEGLELSKCMREVDPDIPIVMVSGYFYQDDAAIEKALAQGLICGFISKPFQHSEILRAMALARP